MKLRSIILAICFAVVAPAASVPFPLADVPILEAGEAAQLVNGKMVAPKATDKRIDLKKYRGKPVIIAMISMTCGHCVTAVQYLIQLQDAYADKGLQVVGVSGDPHAAMELPQWLQRFRPNFPFGYLTQEPFMKLAGLPADARPFAPVILFVDPTGVVRDRKFGNDTDMKNAQDGLVQGTKALLTISAPLMKK
jgi:thiol-disulfide isomerase/thioredoxin